MPRQYSDGTVSVMPDTLPGWYPDPADPLKERLWDGADWVDRTRPRAPISPSPVPVPEPEHSAAGETFNSSVREGFSKFIDFAGRASRRSYWFFYLFSILVCGMATLLAGGVGFVVAQAVFFFPGLAYSVRRLHDRGRSGALLLIVVLPVLGLLFLLYELVSPGTPGANRYGAHPRASSGASSTSRTSTGVPLGSAGGGVVVSDNGNTLGGTRRFLEIAPANWHRDGDPLCTWDEAVALVGDAKRDGWRLPTLEEGELLWQNRRVLPSFRWGNYWSSTEEPPRRWLRAAFTIRPTKRKNGLLVPKSRRARVRPVRDLPASPSNRWV